MVFMHPQIAAAFMRNISLDCAVSRVVLEVCAPVQLHKLQQCVVQ